MVVGGGGGGGGEGGGGGRGGGGGVGNRVFMIPPLPEAISRLISR